MQGATGSPPLTVPLVSLTAPVSIPASGAYTVCAGQNVQNMSSVDITMAAYCSNQNVTGAPFVMGVELVWSADSAAEIQYASEIWYIWVGDSAPSVPAIGTFQVKGDYLTVYALNETTTTEGIVLSTASIIASYRIVPYSTFRQTPPGLNPTGITRGIVVGGGYSNQLAYVPAVTPGTGLIFYPLPLFAGPVWIQYICATADLDSVPTIIDMSQTTSGNLAAGEGQAGIVWAGDNSVPVIDKQNLIFPRSPCALVLNPAATSAIVFTAIGQQGY